MLTIRLSRTGKKKAPQYRLVLQESFRDPWSPAMEILGSYNPRAEKDGLTLKEDRIKYWLGQGAKPSVTVYNMLIDAKIIDADKQSSVTITKKRAAKLNEKVEAEKAKAQEAKAKAAEAKAAEEKAAAEAAEAAANAPAEEIPAEEPAPEATVSTEETPAVESKTEQPAEETEKSE